MATKTTTDSPMEVLEIVQISTEFLSDDAAQAVGGASEKGPHGRRMAVLMAAGQTITDFNAGGKKYQHRLDMAGKIRLERMNSGRTNVIDSHDMGSITKAVGVVQSARRSSKGLEGVIRLMADDKLPPEIRNVIEEDVIRNLSIRAIVHGYRIEETDTVRLIVMDDWEPIELSFVIAGADSQARVMQVAQAFHGGIEGMAPKNTNGGDAGAAAAGATAVAGAAGTVAQPAGAVDVAAVQVAERTRATGIVTVCQAAGADPEPFLTGGQTVEQVTAHFQHAPETPASARQGERDRIQGLYQLCEHPMAVQQGVNPQTFITAGDSVDQARAKIWAGATGVAQADGGGNTMGGILPLRQAANTPGGAAEERMITGIQHAFMERGDPDGVIARHEKLKINAGEYRGISMCDAGKLLMGTGVRGIQSHGPANVAQSILDHSVRVRQQIGFPGFLGESLTDTSVMGAQASVRQFGGISGDLLGAQGSADLSVVVENLMHRMLSAAYAMEGQVAAWRECCKIGMNKDFSPHNHVFLGAMPDFGTRGETGDFPRAMLPNPERATTQVTERGQTAVVDRIVLINDDLGVVFQTPMLQGQAASRLIEHMFFALLALGSGLGPNISVSGTSRRLFNSNHNNISTPAVGVTAEGVNEDRQTMRRQVQVGSAEAKGQSVGGFDLFANLQADTVLLPLEDESKAMIIRDSEKEPGTDNQNTQKGTFRYIVASPYLGGTRRYWFATGRQFGGMNASPICVSFFGSQAPYMFMAEVSIGRGMVWHSAIDVGVDAVNYRGAVTNAGA